MWTNIAFLLFIFYLIVFTNIYWYFHFVTYIIVFSSPIQED